MAKYKEGDLLWLKIGDNSPMPVKVVEIRETTLGFVYGFMSAKDGTGKAKYFDDEEGLSRIVLNAGDAVK
jgi:hypothetical protein